jgi:hypothetical protein
VRRPESDFDIQQSPFSGVITAQTKFARAVTAQSRGFGSTAEFVASNDVARQRATGAFKLSMKSPLRGWTDFRFFVHTRLYRNAAK